MPGFPRAYLSRLIDNGAQTSGMAFSEMSMFMLGATANTAMRTTALHIPRVAVTSTTLINLAGSSTTNKQFIKTQFIVIRSQFVQVIQFSSN